MLRLAAALVLSLAAVPAAAADDLREELLALQRDDTRLQAIAWRIACSPVSSRPPAGSPILMVVATASSSEVA